MDAVFRGFRNSKAEPKGPRKPEVLCRAEVLVRRDPSADHIHLPYPHVNWAPTNCLGRARSQKLSEKTCPMLSSRQKLSHTV